MKKIFSLLVLMAAFCAVSFGQSAPKTAQKATVLQNNTPVKNLKTGQIRLAKGTVPLKMKTKAKLVATRIDANSSKPKKLPAKQ